MLNTPRRASQSKSNTGSSLPWMMLALLMAGVAALLWWQHFQKRQDVVAEVGIASIHSQDVALRLRMHLWRANIEWPSLSDEDKAASRQQVLDDLINEQLAMLASTTPSAASHAVESAFQQFIKQFESLDNWQKRMEWQHLSEVQLRQHISQETMHSLALEAFLQTYAPAPSDEEIQTWFDAHRASMVIPEAAHASHLFLTVHDAEKPSREAEIHGFHQQITTGQKQLAELATQFSDDPLTKKTKGDLGRFSKDRVSEDFASVVFAMQPGELSKPFRTKLGWHIVLLHEKQAARPAELNAETKAEITAFLQDKKRAEGIETWRATLREKAPVKIHADLLGQIDPAPVQ